ncbi:hypothetical protein HKX48_006491 [Thoreauomyces humboldtii]|nr:hypothetical protein HKX48_006491 [Thoreauomyces humboldtii]
MSTPTDPTPKPISAVRDKEMKQSPSADVLTLKKSAALENPLEDVIQGEHAWTIRDIGNNAISGIINDPHDQGKGGSKVFKGLGMSMGIGTGPTVETPAPTPATNIRKVHNAEFDPYIKSLAEVYGKYQLNRAVGLVHATEGTPTLGLGMDAPSPSFASLEEITERLGVRSSLRKTAGSPGMGSMAQKTQLRSANAPALDTVPKIFLEPDFNLSNPHTFAIVCESGDITSASPESTARSSALQEKLSHHLDTVEVHLIREISRRSSSFFAALANLQALHQETYSCVAQITNLRKKLANVSRHNTKKGLEVVRMKRRRGNLGVLYGGVKMVAEVRQTQPMIHILLDQGDYVAALDMIEHVGLVLRGVDPSGKDDGTERLLLTEGVEMIRSTSIVSQNLDLRRVKALASFSAQLLSMSRTIGTVMENELVKIILTDVRETVATMDASKVSSRINGAPASTWVRNMLSNSYTYSVASPVTTTIDAALIAGEERLKTRLLPLILGLLRVDRLGSALQLYKDALLKEVKAMSKKYYPSLSAADSYSALSPTPGSPITPLSANPEKNQQQSALARQLRSMTFEGFFDLMLMVYITLLHVLQRVTIVHEIVILIVKEAQERGVIIGADSARYLELTSGEAKTMPSHPNKLRTNLSEEDEFGESTATLDLDNSTIMGAGLASKEEIGASTDALDATACSTYGQMISESSDVLFSASDLAHVRCAKLIGVRSDQNAQLSPPEFFRLFGATWEFIVGGEALCGRMCFGLKGTLLSQAKAFITRFHEEKTKQIAHVVESEQWAQAEVPAEFQRLVLQFFQDLPPSSPVDRTPSDESLEKSPSDDERDPGSATSIDRLGKELEPGGSRHLVIDHKKYNVVACVLLFLKMLTEYIQCMESIPALTTDALNRIAEALKLFNSRTCQVILGAGAMRSAGLKNISAKHIALAAQALGVIIAVTPHIKDRIQRYLPVKQHVLLGDFDRLLRDYREHQAQLYSKLLSIMEDHCIAQADRLQAIDWDNPEPSQMSTTNACSVPMLQIITQTVNLHNILTRYLPQDNMRSMMGSVFKAYNQCLGDKLNSINLFTGAGKNRLLMDVQYLIQRLASLDGLDGPGNHLEVCVNNIKIKDRRGSAIVMPSVSNQASGGGSSSVRSSSDHPAVSPQQAGSPSAAAGAQPKKTNFASAFGNMLKNKNAVLPGGG